MGGIGICIKGELRSCTDTPPAYLTLPAVTGLPGPGTRSLDPDDDRVERDVFRIDHEILVNSFPYSLDFS